MEAHKSHNSWIHRTSFFFGNQATGAVLWWLRAGAIPMRKRILIVEDDEVVADHLAALVREHLGCVPVVSTTCSGALNRADSVDFGFLDIKLGDEDAFQLASRFRRQGVPFVFVSATDPAKVPHELAAAPFLRKPVSAPHLLAAARRHL